MFREVMPLEASNHTLEPKPHLKSQRTGLRKVRIKKVIKKNKIP